MNWPVMLIVVVGQYSAVLQPGWHLGQYAQISLHGHKQEKQQLMDYLRVQYQPQSNSLQDRAKNRKKI